jgi:hypothetical protein
VTARRRSGTALCRPRWTAAAGEYAAAGNLQKGRPMSKLDQADRDGLNERKFAFPKQRKEPIENASHVRAAIARFNQVEGVSDDERDTAWDRILKAAKDYGVEVSEKSWREIGKS